jgi:hypothetical protein
MISGGDGRTIFTDWGLGDSWSEELSATTSVTPPPLAFVERLTPSIF